MTPGGIRMGAPALTSRGLVEADFEQVYAIAASHLAWLARLLVATLSMFPLTCAPPSLLQVAEFFARGVQLAIDIKGTTGKKLADFKKHLAGGAGAEPGLEALRNDVMAFSHRFPTVGFDESSMKFPTAP